MTPTPRDRALSRLHMALAEQRSLLATGAGSGLAAASAEAGGCDLVVVYNSGRYRTAGHGSLSGLLPYGNANEIVLDLASEVLSAVREIPIVAGVCGTDPFCDLDRFAWQLRTMGVSGVQNFPTIGLFNRAFRDDLEASGILFEREVELMRAARRAGLLTCAFASDEQDARRMAIAGVDILAVHLGVTRARTEESALAQAAANVELVAAAAVAVRDDLLVLFHGGPAVTADDVQEVLARADVLHGFFAASSVERIPVQAAVADAAHAFISLRRARRDGVRDARGMPDFDQPPPALPVELTPVTLPAYLRARKLIREDDEVQVQELGGGLSNVILGWRCRDRVGVVKQSRPRLRVAEEWLSDVRRAINEHDAIELLASRLPNGCVPTLTFNDPDMLAFGMEPAPAGALLWKPELLAGRIDPERARQAGRLLRAIHDATRDDPIAARRFVARPLLDQNRLDPWYRFAARSHPDLVDVFEYAIERLLVVRRVLVHGDFVPKNMFLLENGLLLLDYEVVHYGNPGYDVATFVNHMLLKGFHLPAHRDEFAAMAGAMWNAYRDGLEPGEQALVEQEALVQLGVLMLARVDGKSKVEYLAGTPEADLARRFGRSILRERPFTLDEVLVRFTSASPLA